MLTVTQDDVHTKKEERKTTRLLKYLLGNVNSEVDGLLKLPTRRSSSVHFFFCRYPLLSTTPLVQPSVAVDVKEDDDFLTDLKILDPS